MAKKLSHLLDSLHLDSIDKLSINNEAKRVDVEVSDHAQKKHYVEFSHVNTYFFIDENMLGELGSDGPRQAIRSINHAASEIVAVGQSGDGELHEETIAHPNIMLNTKNASILLEAKHIKIDGESYSLDEIYN